MIKIILILAILACLGHSQESGFSEQELEKMRTSFIEEGDPKEINDILTGQYKSTGPTLMEMYEVRDARAEAKVKNKKKSYKKKHKPKKHSDSGHLYCPSCNRDLTMDGLGPDDPCYDCGAIANEYL